jgi:predicted membrane protein
MQNEIIFYNGFNLLVDIIIFSLTALWFHGVGYRKAKNLFRKK